jgi:hypothetical protein
VLLCYFLCYRVYYYKFPLIQVKGANVVAATSCRDLAGLSLATVAVVVPSAAPICLGLYAVLATSTIAAKMLQHHFLIFKTPQWFYLFSKGKQGLKLYRDKSLDDLLKTQEQYVGNTLQNIPCTSSAPVRKRLHDVARWIKQTAQLNKT